MATPETENVSAMKAWTRTNHDFYYPPEDASIPESSVVKANGRVWDEAAFEKLQQPLATAAKKKPVQGKFPLRSKLDARTTNPQTVLTNHFELKTDKTEFYEYEILDLDQNGPTRKRIQALFRKAVANWTFLKDDQDSFATDGQKTIVSWKNLHDNIDTSKSLGPDLWSEEIKVGRDTILQARFSFVGNVRVNDLLQQSRCDLGHEKIDLVSVERCLNIIIAKSFDEHVVRLSGKKFYVRKARSGLGTSRSLELMRGYHYTVKPGMGNLLMNFNVATSAFFRPILVSEFLADTETFGDNERLTLLTQLRVYVEHPHQEERLNHQGARIKKVSAVGALIETLNFRKKVKDNNGRPIADTTQPGGWQLETHATTVVDHLEAAYGKPVRKGQKAINVGSATDPVWYAAEMLRILPFQLYTRPVPERLAEFMVKEAARSPAQSQWLIENEGLSHLGFTDVKNEAVKFRNGVPLSLYPTMMQVPAAYLPFPSVRYQWNDFRDKARSNAASDGGPLPITKSNWNIPDDQAFHDPKVPTLRYFLIQTLYGSNKASDLQSFETQLRDQLSRRCKVDTRSVVHVNPGASATELKGTTLNARLAEAKAFDTNLVILLIPKFDRSIYAEFKNLADRNYGFRSLCLAKPLQFKDKKYMTNICQKINVKFDGNNAAVGDVEKLLGKDTLVLGADLVHPGRGAFEDSPSVACIVGSVDSLASRFLGSARLQSKIQEDREIIDSANVRAMVTERIKAWQAARKSQKFPSNIIYYRDGVSEGHYAKVASVELSAIRQAWKTLKDASRQLTMGNDPGLKLTALVGVKRHHTRFYPLQKEDMDPWGNNNCRPGTWVDRVVASPYYRDFYLQSHSGIKGTARPTHYFILRNENISTCSTTDLLRQLTHHLCYTYCRATGGISYAAPTYYADRLCDRARLYLPKTWSSNDVVFQNQLETGKANHKAGRQQARDNLYRAGQPYDASMGTKSDAELADEAGDAESIRAFVRNEVLQYAKAEFYEQKTEESGNPWHENLDAVMFWM